MKRLILVLLFILGANSAGALRADAQILYSYLGGALNLNDCRAKARAARYAVATLGGFVEGIYYVNACFGSRYLGDGVILPAPVPPIKPTGRYVLLDIWSKNESNNIDCARDVEEHVSGARCYYAQESGAIFYCQVERRDIWLVDARPCVLNSTEVSKPWSGHRTLLRP